MKLSTIAMATAVTFTSLSLQAAQYRVVSLPLDNVAINHFGQTVTNDGYAITTVQNEFNPPIDLSLLDFDNTNFTDGLEDIEAAKAGNFTTADLTYVFNYVRQQSNPTFQEIATYRSYKTDGVDTALIPGLDVVTDTFDDYTQSVDTIARDALNKDVFVGVSEAPFYTLPYTNAEDETINYVISEHSTRAFVEVNGETTALLPTETILGGRSEAFDINDNMQVVGLGTTAVNEIVHTNIEECEDDEARGDQPIELCLFNLRTGSSNRLVTSAQTRAHVWQLASDGSVIDTKTYGLVFEPEADSELIYISRAFGINNDGIAVGESMTGEIVGFTAPGQSRATGVAQYVAVTYANDEITEILPREENLLSKALFINDDYIVGTVTRNFTGVSRERTFVYNLETQETTYLESFFNSSTTIPRGLNANNIIVGTADIEATNEQVREKHAFMYNIEDGSFIDLNDLIECESDYTLAEAVSINDNNVILANARVRTPSKDIRGETLLNEAGEEDIVDTVYAVKLQPIPGGEVPDCGEDETKYERQGASTHWLFLGILTVAGFLRRRSLK